jgi:hypothetical protein
MKPPCVHSLTAQPHQIPLASLVPGKQVVTPGNGCPMNGDAIVPSTAPSIVWACERKLDAMAAIAGSSAEVQPSSSC